MDRRVNVSLSRGRGGLVLVQAGLVPKKLRGGESDKEGERAT